MCRLVLIFLFAVFCQPAMAAVELRITQGPLSGGSEEGAALFTDIPYAAAPIGKLRWQAPAPALHWELTRPARAFGPVCPQNRRGSFFMPNLAQSEDCLSLNVWTPQANPAAKLAVMVWIHGGAFVEGGAAQPIYDGFELAQHGVVVVSLNYRLGVLGFFHHPALAASADAGSGNFGLLDQIAALKWVRDNIAAFGGDPAKVTIFGESAGGISVNDLVASPLARGLFIRAISESGLGLQPVRSAADAEKAALAFADESGIEGRDADALARLRALPVADILRRQEGMNRETAVQPYIDGSVIPEDISIAFARGDAAKIDYLAGSNSNEASLASAIGSDLATGPARFGPLLPKVRAIYDANGVLSEEQFERELFNDALFGAGAYGLAAFEARHDGEAYVYHFAYLADTYRGKVPGVGHGGEIPYVFGLKGLGVLGNAASEKDRRVIALVQSYWTNFAKTGDPNAAGLPLWPRLTPGGGETLVFDDTTKAVDHFRMGQIGVMKDVWSRRTGLSAP